MNESLVNNQESLEIFQLYIDKLVSRRKDFYFLTAFFDMKYEPLDEIYNKLGYVDGKFNVHHTYDITNDIEKLHDELKNPLLELYNNYLENRNAHNYLKVLYFVKINLYPKWTLEELKNGEKIYYNHTFKISDFNF